MNQLDPTNHAFLETTPPQEEHVALLNDDLAYSSILNILLYFHQLQKNPLASTSTDEGNSSHFHNECTYVIGVAAVKPLHAGSGGAMLSMTLPNKYSSLSSVAAIEQLNWGSGGGTIFLSQEGTVPLQQPTGAETALCGTKR
jgi:hypothetical protein